MGDVDLFELNEAFAAQSLAIIKELGVDPSKVYYYASARHYNAICVAILFLSSVTGDLMWSLL